MSIEELLEKPYWIIDILPCQVPKDSRGQYFTIDAYWLNRSGLKQIKQKHLDLILKLNCYYDISLDDQQELNPAPEKIAETMNKRYVYIRINEAMILSEADDTHMTLFNPDEKLLEMVRILAKGEGLYLWQPDQW